KTDAKGRARIADVPAGAYRLKWWHPRQQRQLPARTIEIGDAPLPLTQVLNVKPRILKPRPPVDADRY
ncbi:MAG: hypothetical protein HY081_09810, partial [Gammaproteobacteria bacterium]|nr:hypothetical protein [Gammaproteobacteria bacterium]